MDARAPRWHPHGGGGAGRGSPTVRFLADLAEAPVLILACATATRVHNEVLAAAQNLLLAARALGIGGTLMRFGHTTDPATDASLRSLFGMPAAASVEYIIPLGYPRTELAQPNACP